MTRMAPTTAQNDCPVITLPWAMPIPWKNQTPPTMISTTPTARLIAFMRNQGFFDP